MLGCACEVSSITFSSSTLKCFNGFVGTKFSERMRRIPVMVGVCRPVQFRLCFGEGTERDIGDSLCDRLIS